MKKIFTVTEVAGSKRSTNAAYTHALIGVYDWKKRIARDAICQEWQVSNFEFATNNANNHIGSVYPGFTFKIDADMQAKGKALLVKYPTVELYLQGMADERVAYSTKRYAEVGDLVEVLCWASRIDLAAKRINEFESQGYKDIKIVSVTRIK